MLRLAVALVAVASLAGMALAEPITSLTVAERFGVPRQGEPVRMGVPLAAGVAKDASELGLTDASGKAVPCQFTPAMKWPDGSLRWVQVVFKATVPAKGKLVLQLVKGQGAAGAAGAETAKLTVEEANGAVLVANGFVKVAVKGAGFNVIDSLAFDPAGKGEYKELVKPHKDGGVVADIDGNTFSSALDAAGKAVVEEKGPECVVIKATGQLKSEAGGASLDYTCRIHVFAGSPMIKVELAYTNCQGKDATDKMAVKDLSVVLPLAAQPEGCAMGGDGKIMGQPLKPGQTAEVLAVESDKIVLRGDGKEMGTSKGKSAKPLTVGWADAYGIGRDAGLAVSIRWFWQMFPKSIQVTGDGAIKVGLYSALASPDKPLDCYMGQGRTHYLTFLPHARTMSGEQVGTAMTARQVPLRAVASPEYYCRVSKAFGFVADADPKIYPAELGDGPLKAYDATLSKSLDAIVKKIDGCTFEGSTRDSYGYNYWGDLFHWSNVKGSTNPKDHLWESNYYDFPWACCLQFARTGDEGYLDVTDPNGLHLADVFMCKWDPEEMYRGSCRYSPPADEVALDGGEFKGYRSVEFNHHKAQSILVRYLLLGDLRAKDDFLLALNNALKNPEEAWRQCRGPGAKLATLYEGYCLTGDEACLAAMKRIVGKAVEIKDKDVKGFSKQGKGGYFMMGVAREGMLYYYWLTGDAGAADTVKAMTDFLLEGGGGLQGPQDAYPLAFCYRMTGDKKYRDAAVKLLSKGEVEMRPKGFGMAWRSTAYAWYYLSKLAENEKPAGK